MSAEVLREASALMRSRAEAATSGRWFGVTGPGGYPNEVRTGAKPDTGLPILFDPHHLIGTAHYMRGQDAHHIASWHPAVALAVAEWLEWVSEGVAAIEGLADVAERFDLPNKSDRSRSEMFAACEQHALAVARTYLGVTE